MTLDVAHHLQAVTRAVSAVEVEGKSARAVIIERTYASSAEDLWAALINPERLAHWFMPISGDLRLHGHYQFEGNAGGEILACEPHAYIKLSWQFGSDMSWLELRMETLDRDHVRLKMAHTAHITEHWQTYGPCATSIGWELSLLGLALYLQTPTDPKIDEAAFAASPDGQAFIRGCGEAWVQPAIASGEEAEASLAAAHRTIAFYLGIPEADL